MFEVPSARHLQIRIGCLSTSRCYAQSLNFNVSYGKRPLACYHALLSILDLKAPQLAAEVRDVIAALEDSDIKSMFSDHDAAVASLKGRYMIYLLQRNSD